MEANTTNPPQHRIAVVLGSVRPNNFTTHAARVVIDELERQNAAVDVIDPASLDLPLPGLGGEDDDSGKVQEIIKNATGVVICTPEYHGCFSSVTKLVIENMGFPSVLAGKPVALVGVAAGVIGAIKSLEALRGVCSHVGAIVLPGPVSVARVREAFDDEGRVADDRVEKQLRGVATGMLKYIDHHVCPRFALEAMVRERAA